MRSPNASENSAPSPSREEKPAHEPVFRREALEFLNLRTGGRAIDATADGGGHTIDIANVIGPNGRVLAIEWDETLFTHLEERIARTWPHGNNVCVLQRTSYIQIESIVQSLKFGPVDGVLFDLGLSSFHLERSKRGFSFRNRAEELDMRFSRDLSETGADILRTRTRDQLAAMFQDFGQERFAKRLATAIAERRTHRPIRTVGDFLDCVAAGIPARFRGGKIHPATRAFQALRIAVNHEFENIHQGLAAAFAVLAPGGRIVAISFHSGEDGIVKRQFRDLAKSGQARLITEKPIRPTSAEIRMNPRARSAMLRAIEKLS